MKACKTEWLDGLASTNATRQPCWFNPASLNLEDAL
jgi:hypothetical protein